MAQYFKREAKSIIIMSLVDLIRTVETSVPVAELNGKLISTAEAAKILGLTPQTIPKYVRKGLLEGICNGNPATTTGRGKKLLLHLDEITLLKKAENAFQRLRRYIPEMYLLHREGASINDLRIQFSDELRQKRISSEEIVLALAVYEYGRRIELRQYRLSQEDAGAVLLHSEIMSRVRISDRNTLTKIYDKGMLRQILTQHEQESKSCLYTYESFLEYMGRDRGIRLFTTRDVHERYEREGLKGIDIGLIDFDAGKNKIGRKLIPGSTRGMNLYSDADIKRLIGIQRRKKPYLDKPR